MDDDEHKVVDSDDGWVFDSEYTCEEESETVSESDGNTAMLTVETWAFYPDFPAQPNLAPLIPNIT